MQSSLSSYYKKEKSQCFFANKKAFEMSFAWLFAIIVGAFILFLAIFAVVKLISTERTEESMKTAKQLTILFEPLETSLEYNRINPINLNKEMMIFNECFATTGNFGKQVIKTSSKTSIGKEFQIPEKGIAVYNKYIFSNKIEHGKNLYVFVKPFEMPFKVSDVLIAYTDKYCFVSPPDSIKEEIETLISNNKEINLIVANETSECGKTTKVCFDNMPGCDVSVSDACNSLDCNSFDKGFVSKESKTVYYVSSSLMYGAIFSSPEIYECNVKRLMLRLSKISLLYRDESKFISTKCVTGLEPQLITLADISFNLKSSSDLDSIELSAKQIKEKNDALKENECGLYIR